MTKANSKGVVTNKCRTVLCRKFKVYYCGGCYPRCPFCSGKLDPKRAYDGLIEERINSFR